MISLFHRLFGVSAAVVPAALPKLIVPNFPDLTIRTRRTSGKSLSHLTTLYLKGARQRTETVIERSAHNDATKSVTIQQCDEGRLFHLNEGDRIYACSEINPRVRLTRKARRVSVAHSSGAEVAVTIDSVDTGERRQYGIYTARRVKVGMRLEPGPGAATPASVEETDGWYMDIPGFGCREQTSRGFLLGAISPDKLNVKRIGNASRGYPIEESRVVTQAGNTTTSKTELLEISEAPLDPSLFELPAGYRRALRTARGGSDLTKPETVSNRVHRHLRDFTDQVRGLFRG